MVIDDHRRLAIIRKRVVTRARLRVDQCDQVNVFEAHRPGRENRQPQLPNHRPVLRTPDEAAEADPSLQAVEGLDQLEQAEGAGEGIGVGVVVGEDEQALAPL